MDINEITDPMLRMAARSKDGEELLVFSLDQVLKQAGPRQSEVLLRCAVVRWFDASVLAVLRDSEEGNERVMDLLRSYSFVRELGDGRLAFHDRVRNALLERWRAERFSELHELHLKLYDYFTRRTTPPGSVKVPKSATNVMRVLPLSANRELWRREALYHLLSADPARGMAELRTSFEMLEAAHRIAEAEILLQVAGEVSLDFAGQHWLNYFQACVLKADLRLDESAGQLESLLRQDELTPELEARVKRSLGEVWAENGQWARATDLYRESLDYFRRRHDARDEADTLMLLGEAYQGLGVNTGSWHVSQLSENPLMRWLVALWEWLLGLPFAIVNLFLRRTERFLPIPRCCARYQNWLLIRLYNTARECFFQARDGYKVLGDEVGLLRAEQRLADITVLYGYPEQALAQLNALLQRPAAQDPYRRAWLQRSLAECHLALGDIGSAQVLLAAALEVFRDLGDVRREAGVLALQGQAAALAGNVEGALSSYRGSLDQFRALGYVAAREKILHNLRTWRRKVGRESATGHQITALVVAEPEKRYVGRFIRSYLPLLQLASILALPIALVLLAYFVPTSVADTFFGGSISVRTFYDPIRFAGVLLVLIPLYMASYALMALGVIFFLPITRIEREQPDMFFTTPEHIARYDSKGYLVQQMPWSHVRAWLSLDRCIWDRPLPLYSRTFLEDEKGEDLCIDGITGWYNALQSDIGQRFAARAIQVPRQNLGYRLLHSKSGAAAVIGAALLFLFTWSANGWIPLLSFLPPWMYALLQQFALSSVLLLFPAAYWLATRPLKLQRTLELNSRYPLFVAALGALPVVAYGLKGGHAITMPILNVSSFVWGIYMLAEALVALAIPRRPWLRRVLVAAALIVALVATARQTFTIFMGAWSDAEIWRADQAAATSDPSADAYAARGYRAASASLEAGGDPYQAYMRQGEAARIAGAYQVAINNYTLALQVAPDPAAQARAYYNRSLVYREAGRPGLAAADWQAAQDICGDPQWSSDPVCVEILRQP